MTGENNMKNHPFLMTIDLLSSLHHISVKSKYVKVNQATQIMDKHTIKILQNINPTMPYLLNILQ